MTITPKDIYAAYPDADLLALEPPEENETFVAYRQRMGGHKGILDCGDTLFAFLLFEAQDEANSDEVIRRFKTAIADIAAVVNDLENKNEKTNCL